MMKKVWVWVLSGMLLLVLSGCAESPEQSVVKEKNMDKMLEEAEKTDHTSTYDEVKEEMQQYETYQKHIEDEKLNVTVDVDAKVEIPPAEKLSVYRVRAKKISQKFLDRVRTALTPDTVYYEGNKRDARTKAVIAQEIKETEKWLREAESEKSDSAGEYKEELENLKEEYKKAPDKVELTDYPLDNKIQSIGKLHAENPGDVFYDWLYELHKEGDVFYGLSDGKDGNYHALFMQNSENYGNCLRYECTRYGGDSVTAIYHADVENDLQYITPNKEGEEPNFSDKGIETEESVSLEHVADEPLTVSEEEAEQKVKELLAQLGLDDEYACFDKGVYSQALGRKADGSIVCRDIYRFLCLRKQDGVFVTNLAGDKMTDGWQDSEYVKKMWGSEAVSVAVNDNGIVDFYYLSPLSIGETVVEKSRIRPFQEIRKTFEKMVVIKNASKEKDGKGKTSVKVTEVKLVYTRISEKDSFDTGLVVPVWNFGGTVVDEYGNEETGNVLSVNAIDGSVIDQRLGY